MKRVGNIYHKIYDLENIREAHRNAKKGKRYYQQVQQIESNPEPFFQQIREMLENKTYAVSPYESFWKTSSHKHRQIFKLPYFPDRIIQHCIIQVMKPIWMKVFIRHTYASLEGRGVHDCVHHIQDRLRSEQDGMKYCLQMDIKQFFPSIDVNILKLQVRRKIKDVDLLWLIDTIIDSSDDGIPVGNYLSQYLGNVFLSDLDHHIKEKLKIKNYFRYCDDLVLFSSSKNELHKCRINIEDELNNLNMTLKDDWRVFPINKGLDFLGYRFYNTHTLMRRRNRDSFHDALKRFKKFGDLFTHSHVRAVIMSYWGWTQHCNGWNMFDLYVNSEYLNDK